MTSTIYQWRSMGRHFFLVSILGFVSGLPFSLLSSTLAAWFSSEGVSIVAIGFLSLLQQPYVFKFLWAPLLDITLFKGMDRRRSWVLICQTLLFVGIVLLAFLEPSQHAKIIGAIALGLVFVSATQDIAIDAYRAELLTPKERGLGATVAIFSFRVATLVSGALALIMADYYGWRVTFLCISALVIPCSLLVCFFKADLNAEPQPLSKPPAFHLWRSIKTFIVTTQGVNIIAFVVLFKLGEAFTSTSSILVIPFLLQGLGFSLSAIGVIGKGVGILATLVGSLMAGVLLLKMSLYRSLYVFATLQIAMNILFVILAVVGKNYTLLTLCIFCENLVAGMGMTALIAFMMGVCNKEYTATQLALLTAVSALPRTFAGPIGATIQSYIGWTNLFVMAVVLAVPVLFVLKRLKTIIEAID